MSNVKKLEFAEGTDVGAPTDLGIQTSTTSINEYPDDAAFVSANGSAEDGDTYLNTTTRKIRYYLNSAWRNAVPESDSADPTKKVEFDLTGATTGTTATFDINNTVSRTYTMQDETGTIPVLPIALASEVDGALPIANGGTGQTSATAAFDALAPTTTTGDLIYHNGTDNVRLGIGSEGQQLKVTSGVPAWGDAGGGSGEKNYVENPSAASAITGWNQVGDLDVARTTTAAELPREHTTGSGIKITADSNVQSTADYVYYDFTLDDVDLSKKLKIQWSQKVTGTYSAGQLAVIITTQADRTTALHTPVTTAIPAMDGEFITSFDAGTTATLSLVIRATTDMTTDGGIVISDVVVGPGVITQGAVVGPATSYTPAFTASSSNPSLGSGSNFAQEGRYYRDGEFLVGNVLLRFGNTGASAGSGTYRIGLPSGLTISASGLPVNVDTSAAYVGVGEIRDDSAPTAQEVGVYASAGVSYVEMRSEGYASITSSSPWTWAAGDFIMVQFRVPIAEWAGSGTVNLAQNDVEYAYNSSTSTSADDTSSFAYGPAGALVQNITAALSRRVRFQTSIQPTDLILIQFSENRTAWFTSQIRTTANYYVSMIQRTDSGDLKGVTYKPVSSTDIDVTFGGYADSAGATNYSWATAGGSSLYWRVVKASAGAAVGFGAANGTSAGLLPPVTSMSDALATQLGYKQYLHGTTYNGGNAPTVTGAGASVTRAVFVPYQMQDGTWRLRLNLMVTVSSSARTNYAVNINGVVFKNVASYRQAVSVSCATGTAQNAYQGWVDPNTGGINIYNQSFTTAEYSVSADLELDSKPTWAY